MEKDTANKVLLAVCAVAKPGEYIILNRSELASNLPADYKDEEVDKAMMHLQADDCISVRYSDGDVYCLSVLTKGFVYGEKLKEYEEKKKADEEAKRESAAARSEVPEATSVAEDANLPEKTDREIATVQPSARFPWSKLFLACTGGAFLGGVIAGLIVALLSKII